MEKTKKTQSSTDVDRAELIQMVKAAQRVGANADRVKLLLQAMRIERFSDDTFVCVILDGLQTPIDVSISTEALECAPEQLVQSVESALKNAYRASRQLMHSTMAAMLEEAGVPPERNFYKKGGI